MLGLQEISLTNLKHTKQLDQYFKNNYRPDFIPSRKHLPIFLFYYLHTDIIDWNK